MSIRWSWGIWSRIAYPWAARMRAARFWAADSWVAVVVILVCGAVRAEERTWEIAGTFVGLKSGTSDVAIIELPDRSRIEVPLAALSEGGRAFVRGRGEGLKPPATGASGSITLRGPAGRVTVSLPESLKGVETDAIWCRTAADAVKVYRLFLASDGLSPEDRAAATARLAEWTQRAAEKRVRVGDVWQPPEQRAQTRRAANEQVQHSIEVIRLGNWALAEDELRKASRLDPDLGTADLILGLGYFLLKPKVPAEAGPNLNKAIELFAEAVRREPDNAHALNDLGMAEMFGGKYASGVAHLTRAAELAADDQAIADNLGLIIRESPGMRPKIPEKLLGDLNESYREVLRNPRLKPLAAAASMTLKSPSGRTIPATKGTQVIADLARHIEEPPEWIAEVAAGEAAVVGNGYLLTTIPLVADATEIVVDDPASPGRQLAAREVASAAAAGLSLLHCEGLVAKPLSVAGKGPATGDELAVVGRPTDGRHRSGRKPVRGRVVAGSLSGDGSVAGQGFVHRGAVARGHGGGPIVDRQGRLVGLEAPLPKTDGSGHALGIGLPIDLAWPLLREHLAELMPASGGDVPADWTDADARAEAGTVVVTCRRKVSAPPPR